MEAFTPSLTSDNGGTITAPEITSPFDVARLKLAARPGVGMVKAPVTISVQRPSKDKWVRVHPVDEVPVTLFEEPNDNQVGKTLYFVDPSIAAAGVLEKDSELHM